MDKANLVFDFFSNEKNYKKVLSSCQFLFSDSSSAEDATQEIFLKLVDSSESIEFPADEEHALRYVRKVALNYRREMIRKNKYHGMNLDDVKPEKMDEADQHTSMSSAEKLDVLNNLILRKAHVFTEEQLKLWHCMYEFLPISEIEKRLGKGRQTIYSLRNKLRDKIRKHISLEELAI